MQLAQAAIGTGGNNDERRDSRRTFNQFSLNPLQPWIWHLLHPKAGGTSPDRKLTTGVAPHLEVATSKRNDAGRLNLIQLP
jgi:hypothetical protein